MERCKFMCSLVSLLMFGLGSSIAQVENHFYGYGYKYEPLHDAFYKLNETATTWIQAKTNCELEGASMFYPKSKDDIDVIIRLFPFSIIWIGAFDDGGHFKTVDNLALANGYGWQEQDTSYKCVTLRVQDKKFMRWDCDTQNSIPYYICRKERNSFDWNYECNLPKNIIKGGSEYLYNKELNKCYKFHTTGKKWEDARKTCNSEKSKLAVITTKEESDYLVELVKNTTTDVDTELDFICLGIFRQNYTHWKTVDYIYLHELEYVMWHYTQPDGGMRECCGAMDLNGRLHDVSCIQTCQFICEHDV